MTTERKTGRVLGIQIDAIDWPAAIERLLTWGHAHQSRYVTICNAHVVVTASRDNAYQGVIDGADMATPDGTPVAWMLRRLGFAGQARINGPDLMWRTFEQCQQLMSKEDGRSSVPAMYLYGSSEQTLAALKAKLIAVFPDVKIAGAYSPPYRALTEAEDAAVVKAINASGAGLVWASLGCPKQEFWMAEHRGRINAVMIGVGAAFDFHAGTIQRAPLWMQRAGLEWLHRLASEPSRLWKRYLVTNTLFILGAAKQLALRYFR